MSSATAPIFTLKARPVSRFLLPVAAAAKIYYGTAVCTDAAGNLIDGGDISGATYKGIANESVDNTDGIAGALSCQVIPPTDDQNRYVQFPCTSPDQTWMAKRVFLTSNQAVVLAASSSNKVVVGTVVTVDATGTNGLVTVDTNAKSALATT